MKIIIEADNVNNAMRIIRHWDTDHKKFEKQCVYSAADGSFYGTWEETKYGYKLKAWLSGK